MKIYLNCIPSFMGKELREGRISGMNEALVKKLLDEIGSMIKEIPLESSPSAAGDLICKKSGK